MWGRPGLLMLVATGCGRLGFDDQTTTIDAVTSVGDGTPLGDATPAPDAAALVECTVSYPGALLCEGFENPGVMWDYTVIDQGSVARTTARAASGVASLAVTTNDAAQFKYARWGLNSVLPAVASGDLYVREWLWLSGATVVNDQLGIMVFGQQVSPFPSANVQLAAGETIVRVEGNSATAPIEFPRDRWVCVGVHLVVDNVAGSMELSLDGVVVASAMGIDTAVAGGYTNLDVGVHYATTAQSAAQLWVDEVVADTQPVACN